jgi:hypothetical protein
MMRDPRLDPQPGDRVRIEGVEFVVTQRDPFDTQYAPASDMTDTRWIMDPGWRLMCSRNKAEVVKEDNDD